MSDTDPDGTATTFTQEQVTAAATKAAKEAERKARQASHTEIAASLGVTVDEAKAIITKATVDSSATYCEIRCACVAWMAAWRADSAALACACRVCSSRARACARAAFFAELAPVIAPKTCPMSDSFHVLPRHFSEAFAL